MKFLKKFVAVLLTLVILSLPVVVWLQRQAIYDWWRLRDYSPPANVAALANATTMNDYGKKLFYVNRPDIANEAEFNAICSREASIVLGCYVPNRGIFLFSISDPRLNGVMEVTAAHEMLHAGYERLSKDERARVDGLTTEAFASITNTRVLETVEKYRALDPGVVPNELHSILATEVRTLPPDLEAYYAKYFSNRAAVVAFSEQYEAEFTKRQAQVAAYDATLGSLKQEIEGSKNELSLQYQALTAERNRLDTLRNSNDVEQYNSLVPGFNAQVANYNAMVRQTDQLINQYNTTVEKRNNLAVEVQGLVEAIDSRPQNF